MFGESSEWRYAGLLVRPVRNDNDLCVDLGLPSRLKWAKCNLGATKPEERGRRYAWGETEPKGSFSWSNYFDTHDGGHTFEKYAIDKATRLELVDDAAHVALGGNFRMPTNAEWQELFNTKNDWNYTWTLVYSGELNPDVAGWKIVRKATGATLFLPFVDFEEGTGEYWSSSLSRSDSKHALSVFLTTGENVNEEDSRYEGFRIRPVSE